MKQQGTKLQRLLKKRGISQAELSRRIIAGGFDIPKSRIDLAAKTGTGSLVTWLAIAKTLGVKVEEIAEL